MINLFHGGIDAHDERKRSTMKLTSYSPKFTWRRGRRSAALALLGTGVALGSVLVPVAAQADPATTYYVSPDGKDGGHCSEAKPCSLERAQHVVRPAAKRADVTVQLADGTYRLSDPLTFDAADGGGDHTIAWVAAPDAHPVITGASKVSGWSK